MLGVVGGWQVPNGQGGQRFALCIAKGYGVATAIDLGEFNLSQGRMKGLLDGAKHMVHRLHQGGRGAEIAVQAVQSVGVEFKGLGASLYVGAQVGPAKTVNGLLGVANHHQRMGVLHMARVVNAVQALVLPRVGVLEFIDHGHWVLIADCLCHLTFIGIQSGVQAL